MSPEPPSPYPAHRAGPTLARRTMPVMALGSLAGVLVFALDRPASRASAGGESADAVAAADTGDGSEITIVDPGSGDGSSIDSTVPDAPTRRETALDTGSNDTTDAEQSTSSTRSTSKATSTKATTVATAKATTAAATKTTTKTTTSSSSSSSCTSYKGPTVSTRWGPVQVKASVSSSGKICSVSVLQHPTGRKSDSINARAVPTLNSRAMSAQSASFNSVSGATITSKAYKQSLQAVLDAAHG